MNTKVTQMVELLFRDVQSSEEVQALHDEVLNNCQDRFDDLVRSGLREEEALAAVMESLKGMEDVLKDYPRKEAADAVRAPEEKEEEKAEEKTAEPERAVFSPAAVKSVQGLLAGCDVEIVEAGEEVVLEKQGNVHYALDEDGTLRIWQEKVSENLFKGISWEESLSSFEHFGDAMNRLAQNFSQLLSGKIGSFGGASETHVTLRLPGTIHPDVCIRTTGGDISWTEAIPGSAFVLGTTSGDIRVRIDSSVLLPEAEISTTSGDVEAKMSVGTVRINTVSGDITWEGDAGVLEMNSTSGDTSALGRIRMMDLNATSGELDLMLEDNSPSEAKINTVSGDISVRLPASVGEVSAKLSTVSGDIRTRGVDLVEESPIMIEAHTVSGDLKISH